MIAVSIKNNWVRFAQGDISEKSFIINQLKNQLLPKNIQKFPLHGENLLEFQSLFRLIQNFLENLDREVYLSFGEDWVETHLIPVDIDLTDEEKEEYLRWMLQQRHGNQWGEMIHFFQNIPVDDHPTVFVCTVHQSVLKAIKDGIETMGGVLVWVEPSIQSSIRVVKEIKKFEETPIVMVEPKGRQFLVNFLMNGYLRATSQIVFWRDRISIVHYKGDLKLITNFFNSIQSRRESEKKEEYQLYLIGEFSENQLSHWIKMTEVKHTEIVNPYKKMKSKSVQYPDATRGSWDVDILGLFLRRIEYA